LIASNLNKLKYNLLLIIGCRFEDWSGSIVFRRFSLLAYIRSLYLVSIAVT